MKSRTGGAPRACDARPMTRAPSRRTVLAALAAGACAAPPVRAQARPLRIVVPFTPGGTSDILARAIGPKLAAALGETVVIENKPGAGGSVAAAEVARAEPDGRTLFMGHVGTLAVNPAVYPKLGYDPAKAFAPVAWEEALGRIVVAGVLGAYLVYFPKATVTTLLPVAIVLIPFPVPAVLMIGLWFLQNLLSGFATLSPGVGTPDSGVAFFAHIGGFVFGLMAVLLFFRGAGQRRRAR